MCGSRLQPTGLTNWARLLFTCTGNEPIPVECHPLPLLARETGLTPDQSPKVPACLSAGNRRRRSPRRTTLLDLQTYCALTVFNSARDLHQRRSRPTIKQRQCRDPHPVVSAGPLAATVDLWARTASHRRTQCLGGDIAPQSIRPFAE